MLIETSYDVHEIFILFVYRSVSDGKRHKGLSDSHGHKRHNDYARI
jgi:hypothetical protein